MCYKRKDRAFMEALSRKWDRIQQGRKFMRKAEVKIGGVYVAKISQKLTKVRLDRECERWGGWYATNLLTGREVRIRTAGKLRREVLDIKQVADLANAIHAAHDEGAEMDAGFDGGEFSGPAHGRAVEQEVRELCKKYRVDYEAVENELLRRSYEETNA